MGYVLFNQTFLIHAADQKVTVMVTHTLSPVKNVKKHLSIWKGPFQAILSHRRSIRWRREGCAGDQMPHLLQSLRRPVLRRQIRVRTHCRQGASSMAAGPTRPRDHLGFLFTSQADPRQPREKPQADGRMRREAAKALLSRCRHAIFYA